jgi:hypothetical protein
MIVAWARIGDDRAVHRARRIGIAVRHEVSLKIGEPVSRRRFDQRNLGRDHRRMELLAMGEEGLDRSGADRTAEIAHHIERPRGLISLSWLDI